MNRIVFSSNSKVEKAIHIQTTNCKTKERNTSLCSSEMNGPDKSRSTSIMSLKDTFPLQSASYTLKITEIKRHRQLLIPSQGSFLH